MHLLEEDAMDMFAPLKEKAVKKYMRLARQVGEDLNPCFSRQLGAVLVKVYPSGRSRILGTGYNGPPRNTPHCDTQEYLREVVWPQLNEDEKRIALEKIPLDSPALQDFEAGLRPENFRHDEHKHRVFFEHFADCRQCPRKLIGAKTGERTELCSCQHAERNAVSNAAQELDGAWAFCFTGVPCDGCAGALINAGIERVYCLVDGSYAHGQGTDYSFSSRFLFREARVRLTLLDRDWCLH